MPVKLMFRAVLILLLLNLTLSGVQAQLSLGLNGGLTRTDFSGDPPKGFGVFGPRSGWSAGLHAEYRLSDAVSLSLNPGYSVLKSKYSILNDSATKVIDSTYLTYKAVSIPLHVRIWSENGRFFVLAGVEMAYSIDFSGKILISPSIQNSSSYNVEDLLFYAHFGGGFIIPLGKPYLSFEFRYSQGLNDLTAPLFQQGSWLPRTKLVNTHFLLGFHYPIGSSNPYKLLKHR